MRILGIDPGFGRMGIAVVEKRAGKREDVLFSDCITTSPKDAFPARLKKVADEARAAIEKWKPDAMALETLLVSKNQKTAMHVAETRGALLYIAETLGIPSYEYSPPEIKLAAGGYGKADKKGVEQMVRMLVSFPKEKVLDDEIDAVAVAITCFARDMSGYPSRRS